MTSNVSVVAHRIPQELFKTIIKHLIPRELENPLLLSLASDQDHVERKKQLKHELGQCSLVCHFWAMHCRPPLFRYIELRAAEDVHRLFEFANTITLDISVGWYVFGIAICITMPSPPWIHLVVNTIPLDAFPFVENYTFNVLKPSESITLNEPGFYAPRSVFYGLPRSLPATKCSIDDVALSGQRFAAFADLVSFLSSFIAIKLHSESCGAKRLSLEEVTWADGDALTPSETPVAFRGMRRCWRKCFMSIETFGCTAIWPLIWLVVTTERPRPSQHRTPVFLDGAEVRRLAALVEALVDNCKCTACKQSELRSASLRPTYLTASGGLGDERVIIIHGVHGFSFTVFDGHVTKIHFDIRGWYFDEDMRLGSPEELGFDWAALDQRVAAFEWAVAFSAKIPEVLHDEFESFMRGHMPLMESRGHLEVEAVKR
ncbi:uncharacterized protein PHACADRAFT_142704 [Phanerochaete carnosa HHB-10118-sp]|uniref:Uncharacterized protein n=1 Tax=Phanerochaete carnosa (strain HHB-10118-sp) TaxID=650164 RepID=K5W0R0_PHACS|nr:uncharacterized protein PHACADRAFT_142704 [Phanerochaete carnosa HHB-10118-sp]EKM57403.1 hypothetical protein PHACADRAFT_142704 [Phanerochaete carnosa HHB-10118-sp]